MSRLAQISKTDKVREFPRKIEHTSYKFDLGYKTVFLNIIPDYLDNIITFELKLEDSEGNTLDKLLIDTSQDTAAPFSIKSGKNINLYSEQEVK